MSDLASALLDALDDDALDALADRLAPRLAGRLVEERPSGEEDGWLTPADAARHLGLTRKRVHDLTSMRALVPDGRDGRTPLYLRSSLDAYARRST